MCEIMVVVIGGGWTMVMVDGVGGEIEMCDVLVIVVFEEDVVKKLKVGDS